MIDDIQYYQDCDNVLKRLLTSDGILFRDELTKLSPSFADSIIQEFEDRGIAEWDSILSCFENIKKDVALPLYYKRHYERLHDEAVTNKKRDELSELSTDCMVKTTHYSHASMIWAIVATFAAIASAITLIIGLFK